MTDRAPQLWQQHGERPSQITTVLFLKCHYYYVSGSSFIMPTDRKTSGVPFAVQHHQPFIVTRSTMIA
jgi:hypothetical protein